MSRALFLKRHFTDSDSSRILDFSKIKRSSDVYQSSDSQSDSFSIYSSQPTSYSLYPEPVSISSPLDLSVKSHALITPPSTPSPCSPVKLKSPESTVKFALSEPLAKRNSKVKKQKSNRKLNFDEDKTSPVSGTIIRDRSELGAHVMVKKGDIDPMYNLVEVTEEAKAELAKIDNKIGDYVCKLCNVMYKDAFSLAQHRCSCIIHVEYKCPECDKVFNCPANLASHRRWHKPKVNSAKTNEEVMLDLHMKSTLRDGGRLDSLVRSNVEHQEDCEDGDMKIPCVVCGKIFKQQSHLRKHLNSHHISEIQHSIRPVFSFHHIAAN